MPPQGNHTLILSQAICMYIPAAVASSSQIRNAQQGRGRWEIPLVPGIWPEVEVPAPRCGVLFSLPWKIPSFGVLTEASCPSRDWLRPSAWGLSQDFSGPRSRVTNLPQKPPSVLGKRDSWSLYLVLPLIFLSDFELIASLSWPPFPHL